MCMPKRRITGGVKSQIKEVGAADAFRAQSEGALLIDVREQFEWDGGNIAGAQHVPVAEVESCVVGLVSDRSRRVVIYCAHGNRSAFVAYWMQEELGYTNVTSLAGGIEAWLEAGYSIVACGADLPART